MTSNTRVAKLRTLRCDLPMGGNGRSWVQDHHVLTDLLDVCFQVSGIPDGLGHQGTTDSVHTVHSF